MTALVVQGDARELPLADASVDLIITSPPYFALRSYTDGELPLDGQIGAEDDPQAYLKALWAATAEWVRVLKPTGSIFVNLGDKFGRGARYTTQGKTTNGRGLDNAARVPYAGAEKSLLGLPWRYALGVVDEIGLLLREELIWDKPNGLPESVRDRCARTHEQWFHFTRRPDYFAAVDEIREAHAMPSTTYGRTRAGAAFPTGQGRITRGGDGRRHNDGHDLGRLPGSVWRVPTRPLIPPAELGLTHFAAFPIDWPLTLIRGWCPTGICSRCNGPLKPVVVRTGMVWRESPTIAGRYRPDGSNRRPISGTQLAPASARIVGYDCGCGEPGEIRPAVVVDPFGGTGTTALAAHALGRVGVSVDLSHDYGRLARWRTTDPGELAGALDVPKPPVQTDGQEALPL